MASPPRKMSKKWYNQSFKDEWLNDENFKEWLKEDASEKGCSYCICCETKIKNANKSMLIAHSKTSKHENNIKFRKSTTKLDAFVKKRKPTENEEVAKAELMISAFIAEHHLPFAQTDHLVEVCKKAFHDSNIAKAVTMRATKATYIIQEGIAYHEKIEIADLCRK